MSIVEKVASIEKETYRTLLSLCDPQAVVDTLNAHKIISFEAVYDIFEVNPDHALIKRVADEADEAVFKEWIDILFEQATLAERGSLKDPASFVARLNKLLLKVSS